MPGMLRLAEIFCATVAKLHPTARIPIDHRAFALSVEELQTKGNKLASSIQTFNGPTGKTSYDFAEMMSLALHSGLISYIAPEFNHYLSVLSPGGAERLLKRIDAKEDELREAVELVESYLRSMGVTDGTNR